MFRFHLKGFIKLTGVVVLKAKPKLVQRHLGICDLISLLVKSAALA